MNFIDTITEIQDDITLDSFITEVSKFDSLDEALIELPSLFMEFYVNNQDSADKLIMKFNINLGEDSGLLTTMEEAETQGTTVWTTTGEETTKVIKYNGEVIVLRYTAESGVWVPTIGFRNIIKGLRYGKSKIDEYKSK